MDDHKEIREKVHEKIKESKDNENLRFIFSHEDMYNELETQVRADIQSNPYEMIVVGQTIITSKFFDMYEQIRREIPQENRIEFFLYHGSKHSSHQKIVQPHFLMPGGDQINDNVDHGYYGKGIYATDNMYYASIYSNGFKPLDVNEKAYIISCRSIFDKSKVKILTDLSYYGKEIDDDIKNNHGVHCALIGSANNFQPIKEDEIDHNPIYAHEYVFPSKYQIIPCSSFTIMRKDHYILWKDENINNQENSQILNELIKTLDFNIYSKDNADDALDIIRKKKYAAVKLITNAGKNLSGRDLIIKAREAVGSNFVCLVFAVSESHMQWISKMENVLFTNDYNDFLKFASLKMNINDVLAFVDELKVKFEKNGYHFRINDEQLLHFPVCEGNSDYYRRSYYAGHEHIPTPQPCMIS